MSTHILLVMRFLVLTGVIMAASTAMAGARTDQASPLADQGSDMLGAAADRDAGGRPAAAVDAAAPDLVPVVAPMTVAAPLDGAPSPGVAHDEAVIAFAPKTSPPRSR